MNCSCLVVVLVLALLVSCFLFC